MFDNYFCSATLFASTVLCSISCYNFYLARNRKKEIKKYFDSFILNQFIFVSGFLVGSYDKSLIKNILHLIFNNGENRDRNVTQPRADQNNSRPRNNNQHVRRDLPQTINILVPDIFQNMTSENMSEQINSTVVNDIVNNLRSDSHRRTFNRFPENTNETVERANDTT